MPVIRSTFLHRLVACVLGVGALAPVACRGRSNSVGRFEVKPAQIRLGYPQCAQLHLAFLPTAPLGALDGPARVFVHIVDSDRKVLRTFDHPLPRAWQPGATQEYDVPLCQSALAPPLPAGSLALTVGLYDSRSDARFPLDGAGPEVGRCEYRAATVDASYPVSVEPMFTFRGAWTDTEMGTDRQVLARRFLTGAGTIRVDTAGRAGNVRVSLTVPETKDRGPLAVDGSTNCGQGIAARLDPGAHAFELYTDGRAGGCEIRFAPIGLPDAASAGVVPRALALDMLAFRPAGS